MIPVRPTLSASPMIDSCRVRLRTKCLSQGTVKEAAQRILDAERRAFRSQKDLAALKEESLKMMVRLKQTMDLKVAEAEKISAVQSKRINELECQLMEAEDIVQSLRSELERLSEELCRRKKMLEVSDEPFSQERTSFLQSSCNDGKSKSLYAVSPQSELLGISEPIDRGTNPRPDNIPEESISKKNFEEKPDLASIVLAHKEMEPCKNGCTQRIRAFEHNLLADHWAHPGSNSNGVSILKNGFHTVNASYVVESEMDKQDITETKNERRSSLMHTVHANKSVENVEDDKLFPHFFSRKRKTSNPSEGIVVADPYPGEMFSTMKPRASCDMGETVAREVRQLDNDNVPHNLQVLVVETDKESCKEFKESVVLADENCSMNSMRKAEVLKWSCSDAPSKNANFSILKKDVENSSEDSGCLHIHCKSTGHDGVSVSASKTKSNNEGKSKESRQEYGLGAKIEIHNNARWQGILDASNHGNNVTNNLGYMSMQEDIMASQTLFQVSETNGKHSPSSTAPVQSIDDKLLKYTFQRKRRREFPCDKKNNVDEKKPSSKKRSPRRRRAIQKSFNYGVATESSRHNRRLVQVAHQLEKDKWKKKNTLGLFNTYGVDPLEVFPTWITGHDVAQLILHILLKLIFNSLKSNWSPNCNETVLESGLIGNISVNISGLSLVWLLCPTIRSLLQFLPADDRKKSFLFFLISLSGKRW